MTRLDPPGFIVHWNFDPVLFASGPLEIRYDGLVWIAAVLLCLPFLQRACRREGADADRFFLHALAGALTGARLAYCVIHEPAAYLADPLDILKIWQGGLSGHGGAIGLAAGTWLYARRSPGVSWLWWLDRSAVPAALGAALIHAANFLGSDGVGRPTSGTWGVVFDAVDAVPRHPVQLYESAACLATFVALLAASTRMDAHRPNGLLAGIFLLGVFGAFTVAEWFRMPQAEFEAGFSITAGQWLSLPFLVAGAALASAASGAADSLASRARKHFG